MTIYRGPGGGGNATSDSEVNLLTSLATASSTNAANAALSASGAADSATSAASSASAAASSASTASTQATNASSSATAAANSASNAATSATNAANSASEAAASATSINPSRLVYNDQSNTIAGNLTFSNGVYNTGDQTIAGTKTFSSAPVVPGLNGGQLAGFRNKIINGKMEIAQRGTSFVSPGFYTYAMDRWVYNGAGTTAAVTVTQQSDVPSTNEFQSSLRVADTTADAAVAAGDVANIQHRLEGYNVRDLIGKTFILSFWVRSSKVGTHCLTFLNSAADRSYVAEYTVSVANTWEYKSVTVAGGLITAGTWNWTNGIGILLSFTLMAGTTFHTTTAGSWQTGTFHSTAAQVNCLDTVGNIFAITGVQLEVGSVATPFEHRPYGMELALCQRYYIALPTTSFSNGDAANVNQRLFPVTMRATPTMTATPASGTGATFVGTTLGYSQNGLHSATVSVSNVTASAEL